MNIQKHNSSILCMKYGGQSLFEFIFPFHFYKKQCIV